MCYEFFIKIYKFVTQRPHIFNYFYEQVISLFKKYETFHKFPSEFVTKHILFGISLLKDFV